MLFFCLQRYARRTRAQRVQPAQLKAAALGGNKQVAPFGEVLVAHRKTVFVVDDLPAGIVGAALDGNAPGLGKKPAGKPVAKHACIGQKKYLPVYQRSHNQGIHERIGVIAHQDGGPAQGESFCSMNANVRVKKPKA